MAALSAALVFAPSVGNTAEVKDLNRVTTWNKVTDWFATVGKNERDKLNILRQRKVQRRAKRQEKAKRRAEKERRERASQYRSSYISQ